MFAPALTAEMDVPTAPVRIAKFEALCDAPRRASATASAVITVLGAVVLPGSDRGVAGPIPGAAGE
jgi:hypothetical protein